eukprot:COSAG06_NODE_64139_length_260_cov_0.757764_1_plen_74_part_10
MTGKKLGEDICASTRKIERRLNNGPWSASKPYMDVCVGSPAAKFGADPVNCTKSTWYRKAVVDLGKNEECDGQV